MPTVVAASAVITQTAPELLIATRRRPFGFQPFEIQVRRLDETAHIRRAPNAVMLEERIDDAVFVRQRTCVRLRCLTSRFGAAGFERDDRQIAVERDGCEFFKIFLLGNAFEIKQHQLHLGIFRDRNRELADRDICIIASRMGVPNADAALAQKPNGNGRQRTTLAQHRDVTGVFAAWPVPYP